MSISVMNEVWKRSAHSGTELLMLLALADFSEDSGNSYPAVATLARKCRMQPRNANYILKRLQESGELQVKLNEGPKGQNRYRIVLDALGVQRAAVGLQRSAVVQSFAGMQRAAATPATDCAKPLQPLADKPSLNRQEPSKAADPARSDHEGKRGCRQARSTDVDLPSWLERIKAKGEKAIPPDDAVHQYAEKVGLPRDFLLLAWQEFRVRYAQPDAKRYKDWRAVFRRAVRENWLKLWFIDGDGYLLTTAGIQAQRVHTEQAA